MNKQQAIEILTGFMNDLPTDADDMTAFKMGIEALASAGEFADGAEKPSRFAVTTYAVGQDGTRSRQIDGFSNATVIVRGERSAAVAQAIIERFSARSEPRTPLGSGGCVRLDGEHGVWLLNRADRGWSASGIYYDSWRELLNDWDIQLGFPKADDAGVYWPVESRSS